MFPVKMIGRRITESQIAQTLHGAFSSSFSFFLSLSLSLSLSLLLSPQISVDVSMLVRSVLQHSDNDERMAEFARPLFTLFQDVCQSLEYMQTVSKR